MYSRRKTSLMSSELSCFNSLLTHPQVSLQCHSQCWVLPMSSSDKFSKPRSEQCKLLENSFPIFIQTTLGL